MIFHARYQHIKGDWVDILVKIDKLPDGTNYRAHALRVASGFVKSEYGLTPVNGRLDSLTNVGEAHLKQYVGYKKWGFGTTVYWGLRARYR